MGTCDSKLPLAALKLKFTGWVDKYIVYLVSKNGRGETNTVFFTVLWKLQTWITFDSKDH